MGAKTPDIITSLNAKPFFFQGGDHGVLLIHGFTGSVSHMRPLGEALRDQGFTVEGINLPGHGTRREDMIGVDWHNWLEACRKAYLLLHSRCSHVSVAGLSMGGVLTLLLAEEFSLASAVFLSTPMAVKNKLAPMARFVAPIYPMINWRISAQRAEDLDQEYDFGYKGFPTARAGDLMRLIKMAKGNLASIICPVLVVQSHDDRTITEDSAETILAGVRSGMKEMLWLKDVPHVVTISKEKDTVNREVAAFLKRVEGETFAE